MCASLLGGHVVARFKALDGLSICLVAGTSNVIPNGVSVGVVGKIVDPRPRGGVAPHFQRHNVFGAGTLGPHFQVAASF